MRPTALELADYLSIHTVVCSMTFYTAQEGHSARTAAGTSSRARE